LFDNDNDNQGSNNNALAGGTRIFVPLCGKSVDLAYLASHPQVSYVVGIDIVHDAVEQFIAEHPGLSMNEVQVSSDECGLIDEETTTICHKGSKNSSIFRGPKVTFLIQDLFHLLNMTTADRAKIMFNHHGEASSTSFTGIYDRGSLVAIHPSLRVKYITLMDELLDPGGTILLVSLDRRQTISDESKYDGPPFSLNELEIRKLYETQSWVESVTLLTEVDELTTNEEKERWKNKGVLELYEMVYLIKKK
jgi:hypothetical protein